MKKMHSAIFLFLILHAAVTDASVKTFDLRRDVKSKQTLKQGESGLKSRTKSKNKMYTVKGQLKFGSNGAPNSIPDGSQLTVKLQDTSRMDAPTIELGKMVKLIKGYKNGDVISYEIKTDKRPPHMEASVSFLDYLLFLTVRFDFLP